MFIPAKARNAVWAEALYGIRVLACIETGTLPCIFAMHPNTFTNIRKLGGRILY
jgi:hypothetical protein